MKIFTGGIDPIQQMIGGKCWRIFFYQSGVNRVQEGACGTLLVCGGTLGQCGTEHMPVGYQISWETFTEEFYRKYFL